MEKFWILFWEKWIKETWNMTQRIVYTKVKGLCILQAKPSESEMDQAEGVLFHIGRWAEPNNFLQIA